METVAGGYVPEPLSPLAFIGIGMTEVSTCDMIVKEGQHVTKGTSSGE